MCLSRPDSRYKTLKAIYDAIHSDNVNALRKAIHQSFDINQSILVYESNYMPVNPALAFNEKDVVSSKKILEIAAAKGRIHCVSWLLDVSRH